jgi:hypothetical protein
MRPGKITLGMAFAGTWSEDHLGAEASREFDAGMTKLLSRYAVAGMLEFAVQTRIEWGRVRT